MDLYGDRGFPPGAELPPKKPKLLVSHTHAAFIEERRCLLEAYLMKMLTVPEVMRAHTFNDFLTDNKLPYVVEVETSTQQQQQQQNNDNSHHQSNGHETQHSHDMNHEQSESAAASALTLSEDAELTEICIPSTRIMSDHVLYQIDCTNCKKRRSFARWTVLKRFGQFFEMDQLVRASVPPQGSSAATERLLASLPTVPGKQSKLLFDHMEESFIEHRRLLLENYLHKMLRHPLAATNKHFLAFCGVSG